MRSNAHGRNVNAPEHTPQRLPFCPYDDCTCFGTALMCDVICECVLCIASKHNIIMNKMNRYWQRWADKRTTFITIIVQTIFPLRPSFRLRPHTSIPSPIFLLNGNDLAHFSIIIKRIFPCEIPCYSLTTTTLAQTILCCEHACISSEHRAHQDVFVENGSFCNWIPIERKELWILLPVKLDSSKTEDSCCASFIKSTKTPNRKFS